MWLSHDIFAPSIEARLLRRFFLHIIELTHRILEKVLCDSERRSRGKNNTIHKLTNLPELKDSSYKRHLAKTITWRIIGTLDTILLSWLISGDPMVGLKIGLTEVVTKMLLYYFHERLWFRITWAADSSNRRHLLKTISWRIVGTIDTMILAWLISGDPMIGLKVGFAEVITKMLLYYLHERAWYKVDFGLEHRISKSKKILDE